MTRASHESKPQSRTAASEAASGTRGRNTGSTSSQSKTEGSKTKLAVRSVLIEPRETEPPRVSVSVEYESEAPSLKALQKAAMETIHDVVRREGKLEDLGYRESQTKKTLTQTFSLEDK